MSGIWGEGFELHHASACQTALIDPASYPGSVTAELVAVFTFGTVFVVVVF